MALTKCKDCGKKVSKKAETCPNCGAPIKKKPTHYGCGTLILFATVAFILLSVFLSNDTSTPSAKKTETARVQPVQQPQATVHCDHGTPVSGQLFVKGRNVNFRTGPGINYDPVINQKATRVLGKTQYRTLWPSMVLEGRCETDEWLQARIVKADGSQVQWEIGWAHKQFVTGTASADMQAGLLWDIDGETDFTDEEKVLLKRGALKVLVDEKNCKEITTGYRSGSRRGAYYVTCNAKNGGAPFNVWFTSGEVEAGGTLGVPEAYPEAPSRLACEKAIEARVSHPSTLDIHQIVGYATKVHNNGNRTVIQEFTAKNSFNLKLKQRARCLIQPNGSLEITITEAQ